MKKLDIHTFVITILGLAIAELTFSSPIAIAAVFLVLQFPLLTRYVFRKNKDFARFWFNELVVLVLCLAALAVLRE